MEDVKLLMTQSKTEQGIELQSKTFYTFPKIQIESTQASCPNMPTSLVGKVREMSSMSDFMKLTHTALTDTDQQQ